MLFGGLVYEGPQKNELGLCGALTSRLKGPEWLRPSVALPYERVDRRSAFGRM